MTTPAVEQHRVLLIDSSKKLQETRFGVVIDYWLQPEFPAMIFLFHSRLQIMSETEKRYFHSGACMDLQQSLHHFCLVTYCISICTHQGS